MAQSNAPGAFSGHGAAEHVPGSRRNKVFGYLKAANELRQSYQSQWHQREGNEDDVPGSFPDVDIVRSGDEDMLLFPSYARKHVRKAPSKAGALPQGIPGSHGDIESPEDADIEYWKKEWEKYEDDHAIVDVDVRGWIYSPHRTPLSRRNRLVVAVARKLSGIAIPTDSPEGSRSSSQTPDHRTNYDAQTSKHEDDAAAQEAVRIMQHGEAVARHASVGGYSTEPSRGRSGDTPHGSRPGSPGRDREPPGPGHLRHAITDPGSMHGDDLAKQVLQKRSSWNVPSDMTHHEITVANMNLMTRLKPFLTVAMTNTPITVFFFNDDHSQSRTVNTDDSGHFSIRAALEFIPTSIRVLASERLSATEKVHITETQGVSLISDIDDTVKHSSIASGAREIFRNTFIRDLGDLTIPGVKEWYTKLAGMHVQIHYVSNSPWQLFPLLQSYFSKAGLPPGSFHLKQYTGMLQGIFEPAAERKKGSLVKIMADFPERKFVLVGDSGEADLEVYTDTVLENPEKILAVFIRDVTTPVKKNFFDQGVSNYPPDSHPPGNGRPESYLSTRSDAPEHRPNLPVRQSTQQNNQATGDLIDLSDEPEEPKKAESTFYSDELNQLRDSETASNRPKPPNRPAKPSALRSVSNESSTLTREDSVKKSPPPKPRRPSVSVQVPPSLGQSQQSPLTSNSQNQLASANSERAISSSTLKSVRPHLDSRTISTKFSNTNPGEEEGYATAARRQLATAYNSLPTIRSESPSGRPENRRGLSSYPAAAARWATGASGGDPAAGGDGGAHPGASYDKKEEVWKRRWARSEEIMKARGVVLKTWRVGSDVMDECVGLVEKAQMGIERDIEAHENRRGGISETGHYKLKPRSGM